MFGALKDSIPTKDLVDPQSYIHIIDDVHTTLVDAPKGDKSGTGDFAMRDGWAPHVRGC